MIDRTVAALTICAAITAPIPLPVPDLDPIVASGILAAMAGHGVCRKCRRDKGV